MLKITTQKNEKGIGISFILETESIKKSFYNFIFPIKIFFHSKINNIKLKVKSIVLVLKAKPEEISLEKEGEKNLLSLSCEDKKEAKETEETLNLFEKPVYKKEKEPNFKEDAVRAIAGLNILLLILQASMFGALFAPSTALAGVTGSIWTTRDDCGTISQNVNKYDIGEDVYINGTNFNATTTYSWDITGKPGSADPSTIVASGNHQTDSAGDFCFNAYTVAGDDDGVYGVTFDGKNDSYQVDGDSAPVCGDGIVNGTEECEGDSSEACTTQDGYAGTKTCVDCSWGTCETNESCGDGTVNGNEQCDDGNNDDGDGCSATCATETSQPFCGDGIVNGTEECDGDSPQQCTTQDGYSGTETCIDCAWGTCETSESCGDGTVNGNEQCDDGGNDDGDGCSATCTTEQQPSPVCGNDIVEQGEECDGNSPQACTTQDGYSGTKTCVDCVWGNCETNESCGDGIKNGNEECDGQEGIEEGQTCTQNCTIQGDALCEVPVDVVLVMDISGSMNDGEALSKCEWSEIKPYGSGNTWFLNKKYNVSEEWCQNTRDSFDESYPVFQFVATTYTASSNKKIIDAKSSANSFLDNFKTDDQSALVSFSDNANLVKTLSNNHGATQSAVNALAVGGATNIGDAIQEGILELNSSGANPQANKIMVLLTDGKANKPNGNGYTENSLDVQYAKDKAQEAADQGYKIFTIGLGSDGDINQTMLQEIADITDATYYHVPNGDGLKDIYDEIAWDLCQYGSISGCKYLDSNADGDITGDTTTLSGWDIVLSGNASSTQSTDVDGCYSFAGLLAGSYSVAEGNNLDKLPFLQTYPQTNLYNITLIKNENRKNIDFGNYFPVCGNNVLDEGEECDDGNNDDGDGCSAICQTEEVEPVCGNDILEGNEQCDDGNLVNGDGCSNQCIITYQCNDGVDNDQDGLIDFSNDPGCDSLTDNNETDGETGIQEGDIVINEVMQNPSGMTASIRTNKQWFEVYNNSNKTIDLQDCVLSDNGFNSHIIQTQLSIDAGNYAVLGYSNNKSLNGNIDVDYVYFPGFFLRDSSDEIILTCDNTEIDRVEYDNGTTFPDPTGASMILANPTLDNNIGSNWCTSITPYGDGDLGTPGAQNDACSGTCVYSDWENQECVSDGFRKQTRIQISEFEYCTDLEQNIEDEDCSCVETEVPGDCVSNTHRRYSFTYDPDFNYCEKDPEEREDETCAGTFVGATISGCKYIDSNNDGDITGEQLATDSWLILLDLEESFLKPAPFENGCYVFSGLDPGTYTVYEAPNLNRMPFVQTYPAGKSYTITLSENQATTSIDFGNYFPVCSNGILDSDFDETCDDGNTENGDGCSSVCQIEEEPAPAPSGGGGGGAVLAVILFIFNENQKDITDNGATITWQTSLYASTQVIYSSEHEDHLLDEEALPHYGYASAFPDPSDETMISVHKVTLPDCEPCTTYYYRIVSYTNSAFPVFSEEMSFTTLCTKVSPTTPSPEPEPTPEPTPGPGPIPTPTPGPSGPTPSPEPEPLPEPEPTPWTPPEFEPEPEPEPQARGFMPNLFAAIGNILGDFGTTCHDALPWWAILLLAAYALFQGLINRFKSSVLMIRWLALAGGLVILAMIFFFTGYRQVAIWVFLLLALFMVLYWRFLIFQRKIKFDYDQGIV